MINIFPQPTIVYETTSPFSGKISVVEFKGERLLKVGGYTQSSWPLEGDWGRYDKRYWGRALLEANSFFGEEARGKRQEARGRGVLILGLAGGTLAHLVSRAVLDARIVGVDIDSILVDLGKKYFHLEEVSNLKIEIADARDWARDYRGDRFDVIFVDLFCGGDFTVEFTPVFLGNLKKVCQGKVVINQVFPKKEALSEAVLKLREIFEGVKVVNVPPGNVLLVCSCHA